MAAAPASRGGSHRGQEPHHGEPYDPPLHRQTVDAGGRGNHRCLRHRATWLLLLSLYLALLVFYGTDGISSVPWFELVAKAVPPNRRGRLFGTAQIAGGLGGMGVGALVAVILGSTGLGFPVSYALLFLIAVFFSSSTTSPSGW